MNAVFVDTAGWLACADAGDAAHASSCAARDAALEAGQVLVTTDYVLDETLTLIRLRLGHKAVERWWSQIDGSHRLRWEWIDGTRFDKARHLLFHHHDKDYSFTDCTSFVLMWEFHLTHALTTDGHFQRAGFQILPAARKAARRRSRGPRTRKP